jgi:hypothetical protein
MDDWRRNQPRGARGARGKAIKTGIPVVDPPVPISPVSLWFSAAAFWKKVETSGNEQWSDVAESRCPKGTSF